MKRKSRIVLLVIPAMLLAAIFLVSLLQRNSKLQKLLPTGDIGSCIILIEEDGSNTSHICLDASQEEFDQFIDTLGDVNIHLRSLYGNFYDIDGVVYRIEFFDTAGHTQKRFVVNDSTIFSNHVVYKASEIDILSLINCLENQS